MSTKRRRNSARSELPDGYYWLKNFINLRGGGHVGEWRLARVVGGQVQVLGPDAELDLGCPYLEHARWVRIDPPDADTTAVRMVSDGRRPGGSRPADREGGRDVSGRARVVAEGIVDAFLSVHESAARYYGLHPEHREEFTDKIARLIERVRE